MAETAAWGPCASPAHVRSMAASTVDADLMVTVQGLVVNVNLAPIPRRNTELADAAPAALDTRRANARKTLARVSSKVRRKSANALMRSVFLQPAGLAAPATAMPACRGWCLQEPPRHQRRAARLRSSWHGQRGCCWPRCGRCGHQAGPRLVALWAHSVSVQHAAL